MADAWGSLMGFSILRRGSSLFSSRYLAAWRSSSNAGQSLPLSLDSSLDLSKIIFKFVQTRCYLTRLGLPRDDDEQQVYSGPQSESDLSKRT